ncbi:hypothetical protein MelnitzEXVC044M_75 [Methylophilales phage Melnitz EXVC044M]|nr:hypothetical protein Melnitz1EXVC043M_74 [Methylophilales phage Melnitz-1 EXVC043M]QZI94585.1 hypothetical protein Melnitz2EXVC040M_75 [Methylophilales phage Melnitz-2 EXVC040M]QZI94807.1 hypothetical protein MelnitzEXVC044M_75 [Methylophilales phage Melnitz EXVC044M]QZI95028.1 hypothetical protein Melnitz3EXVC039M_75 [Methylophilales phage Melnitz-3 EXVC039M]
MIKFILGILVGVVIITYYPQIGSDLLDLFRESGVRDKIINQLEGI